jgi:hypothetical protein
MGGLGERDQILIGQYAFVRQQIEQMREQRPTRAGAVLVGLRARHRRLLPLVIHFTPRATIGLLCDGANDTAMAALGHASSKWLPQRSRSD